MKYLVIILSMLFVLGCKGSDGDDGTANVTITADSTFTSSASVLGCFIVSDSDTSCLCYEGGTGYTGTAASSSFCSNYGSIDGLTLVADQTVFSSAAAGDHTWCMTTSASVDCTTGGTTGTVAVTVNSGESGSSDLVVLPKDGDNGAAKAFTLTFSSSTATITEN